MCSNQRKVFHEANLKEILAKLKLGLTVRDRYMKQITESVEKRLRVEKKWIEQSHQRLSEELKTLFPDLLKNPVIEQASLKFARAFFTLRRKYYLKRLRRRERKKVNRVADKTDLAVVVEPGPILPAVSRQRQSQSNTGPSIITTPSRAANLSISASFIASTYMERVLQYSEGHNLKRRQPGNKNPPELEFASNLDQTRSRAPSPPITPPNISLTEPESPPVGTSQSHISTLPEAVAGSETNRYIDSNEQVKSGIEEVKSFLENCSPSMVHHFDSFIKAGVKDGEYLKALGRLCASGTKALSMVLGPNLSVIDSILLREYLIMYMG